MKYMFSVHVRMQRQLPLLTLPASHKHTCCRASQHDTTVSKSASEATKAPESKKENCRVPWRPPNPTRPSLLLVGGDVEFEEDDVLVLNDVILALLPVLAGLLHLGLAAIVLLPVAEVVDLGLDEASLEVRVDGTSGLGRHPAIADGPAAALVGTRRVVVDQLQSVVPLEHDLANLRHGLVLLEKLGLLLVAHVEQLGLHRGGVEDHLLARSLLLDPLFHLGQPLVLLPQEVGLRHVHKVQGSLRRDQMQIVQVLCLLGTPVAKARLLLLRGDPIVDFEEALQAILLLFRLSVAPHLLLERVNQLFNGRNVLQPQLVADDLEVAHRVDAVLNVGGDVTVVGLFERAAHVEDRVHR
mmetsp:Transcript_26706/g.67938  ORF Transcript_26706/g.67938 Transcript_26706/m.67938 type:complete len:355 (+) Transcript_26706:113-1177(+)